MNQETAGRCLNGIDEEKSSNAKVDIWVVVKVSSSWEVHM